MRKYTVKYCDFEKVAKIQKDFKDCVGLTDFDKNTIFVDANLPEVSNGSKRMTLAHEIAHLRLHHANVVLPKQVEEDYCEMEAVFKVPRQYLSVAESLLKKLLKKDVIRGYDMYTIFLLRAGARPDMTLIGLWAKRLKRVRL